MHASFITITNDTKRKRSFDLFYLWWFELEILNK
jgi:hypothetical protein